jgi:hypothetical protein
MTAGDWLAHDVAPRTETTFGRSCDGLGSTDWSIRRFGGREWHARSDCGSLDAVAFGPRLTYVFSMAWRPNVGDEERAWLEFDAFLATVRLPGDIDTSPVGPMTREFTSARYGYAIGYPDGWDVEPATQTWTPGTRPEAEALDRFDEDDAAAVRPRFSVVGSDLPAGIDEEVWLQMAAPSRIRRAGDLARCDGLNQSGMWSDAWSAPRPIGAHMVRTRSACGFVDGVAFVGRRAYVFTAEGGVALRGPDQVTRATFDAIVGTFMAAPST